MSTNGETQPGARKRVLTVVGARPQFIKAAVVSRAMRRSARLEEIIIHTGQHYDAQMSEVFFRELEIPAPRHNLQIGSEAPSIQLAHILKRLSPVLDEEAPDAVLVYGDTNSTLAAAIAAAQRDIPLIHIEAGERIYQRRQLPEEVNRVTTDNLASLNLTSTRRAMQYLRREGLSAERVRFVGDPLYDLFLWTRPRIDELAALRLEALGMRPGEYHLATIHRVQNTQDRATLLGLMETLDASRWPVVMPVHPRVRKLLAGWAWRPTGSLRLIEPAGYFDFMRLLLDCRCCFTDSGGVTREAFFARRPCLIPMETCYWADAVEHGWAIQTSLAREEILEKLDNFPPALEPREDFFGDGRAAERIVQEVEAYLGAETHEEWWCKHPRLAEYPPVHATNFHHAHYREMLERLRARGYHFALFPEAEALLQMRSPFALLRHEIDYAPEQALALARIEAEAGARATYFINVRSDLYNVFSPGAAKAVRELLQLGHALGLSCDVTDDEDLAEACRRDAALVEQWFFGQPVTAVKFRLGDESTFLGAPLPAIPYPHTSMPLFHRIPTFSDARGRWQMGSPLESRAFREGWPMQINTHPVWWNASPVSANEALMRLIDARQEEIAHLLITEEWAELPEG